MRSRSDIESAIDVGTNTVLMVSGRRRPEGQLEIIDDVHGIARLGQGVDAERRIRPEAMQRLCRMLVDYRRRATALGAVRIRAFGTSALRDAANRDQVVAEVARQTQVQLSVVSGADEAHLTFTGAAFGLDLPRRYAVIDIGGGSTELAVGRRDQVEASASVDTGAVRLTEQHFTRLPPGPPEQDMALTTIRSALAALPEVPEQVPLVGVAGTVTTLGAIDMGIEHFDAEILNGHVLSLPRVEELCERFLSLSADQIRAIPQVNVQRADIISAGALILRTFLRERQCPEVVVSTRGIRYGLLDSMLGKAQRHIPPAPPLAPGTAV